VAGWPVTGRRRGGVLNITAAARTAGFQWWRSGDITRTQNVSEYVLVLALCLCYRVAVVVDGQVSQLPGRHGQAALHGGDVQQGDGDPARLVLLTHRTAPVQGLHDLAPQRGIYLHHHHNHHHHQKLATATRNRRSAAPYKLEMWANAQPDGRPAENRWRPLFNAAKFG